MVVVGEWDSAVVETLAVVVLESRKTTRWTRSIERMWAVGLVMVMGLFLCGPVYHSMGLVSCFLGPFQNSVH